jgi:hypothetical protein
MLLRLRTISSLRSFFGDLQGSLEVRPVLAGRGFLDLRGLRGQGLDPPKTCGSSSTSSRTAIYRDVFLGGSSSLGQGEPSSGTRGGTPQEPEVGKGPAEVHFSTCPATPSPALQRTASSDDHPWPESEIVVPAAPHRLGPAQKSSKNRLRGAAYCGNRFTPVHPYRPNHPSMPRFWPSLAADGRLLGQSRGKKEV